MNQVERDSNVHDIYANNPIDSQLPQNNKTDNQEVFKDTETINLKQGTFSELNDNEMDHPDMDNKNTEDRKRPNNTSMANNRTSVVGDGLVN